MTVIRLQIEGEGGEIVVAPPLEARKLQLYTSPMDKGWCMGGTSPNLPENIYVH